jgi:hypothetical protein
MTNIAEAGEALLLRGEHIISILLRSTSPQARMHSPRAHIYDCQPACTRTCRTCRTCTSLSLTPTHIAITSSGSISGSGALAAAAAVAAAADSGAAAAPSRSHAFAAKSSRRVGLPDERRCDSVATSADATKGGAGASATLTGGCHHVAHRRCRRRCRRRRCRGRRRGRLSADRF